MLGKIIEDEKIAVTPEEIDTEIQNMIKGSAENKDELFKVLNTEEARQSIEQQLIARKAVQRLTEIAQGNAEKEKPAKKADKKSKKEAEQ